MPVSIDVLLSETETAEGRRRLRAVVDELTLTYTIVEDSGDRSRELRRHVRSLGDARRWAALHGERPN